jgi:hypothetical protein
MPRTVSRFLATRRNRCLDQTRQGYFTGATWNSTTDAAMPAHRMPRSALLAWLPWREQIAEDDVTEWRLR